MTYIKTDSKENFNVERKVEEIINKSFTDDNDNNLNAMYMIDSLTTMIAKLIDALAEKELLTAEEICYVLDRSLYRYNARYE